MGILPTLHEFIFKEAFNVSMSKVRVSVDWVFGDILEYFFFLDFKKDLKVGLSAIGKMYVVCALLRNAVFMVQLLQLFLVLSHLHLIATLFRNPAHIHPVYTKKTPNLCL